MTAVSAPSDPAAATISKPRLDSIDTLRGIVMVLMALDHTRDFFSRDLAFDPTDLAKTNPALFLTRWITHFCAPVFIFLAGTGAFLATTRGSTRRALSWFLLTRGLWLVILELTWVRFGWLFNLDYHFSMGIVIWVIGWSMVSLAALIHLPRRLMVVFALLLIAGHNLLDQVEPESFGSLGWLWRIVHSGGMIQLSANTRFIAGYPLVPWIGVMALGFGFGPLLLRDPEERRHRLLVLGGIVTLLFVVIRATNCYGDAQRWSEQKDFLFSVLSFLNCTKYPPSLCYLLMTLGPAFLVLAALDRGTPRWLQPVCVFGRVPLFFYLLHLPFIHGLAVIVSYIRYGDASWWFANDPVGGSKVDLMPAGYGFGLPVIYLVWAFVVLALFPACRWFAGVKRRHHSRWLSYL